jgi:hypothetical protein
MMFLQNVEYIFRHLAALIRNVCRKMLSFIVKWLEMERSKQCFAVDPKKICLLTKRTESASQYVNVLGFIISILPLKFTTLLTLQPYIAVFIVAAIFYG